jgi:hypothetical protein
MQLQALLRSNRVAMKAVFDSYAKKTVVALSPQGRQARWQRGAGESPTNAASRTEGGDRHAARRHSVSSLPFEPNSDDALLDDTRLLSMVHLHQLCQDFGVLPGVCDMATIHVRVVGRDVCGCLHPSLLCSLDGVPCVPASRKPSRSSSTACWALRTTLWTWSATPSMSRCVDGRRVHRACVRDVCATWRQRVHCRALQIVARVALAFFERQYPQPVHRLGALLRLMEDSGGRRKLSQGGTGRCNPTIPRFTIELASNAFPLKRR